MTRYLGLSTRPDGLSQPQRVAAFFINCAIFYGAYVWATGHAYITGGGETLWLASALAWWTLGLLSAPWYRPPRDALAAGLGAVLALLTLDLSTARSATFDLELARGLAIGYAIFVAVAAMFAVFIERRQGSPWRRFTFLLAERLSSGPFLFGTAALISIFGFYNDPVQLLVLTSIWLLFAVIRPVELLFNLRNEWRAERAAGVLDGVGQIRRVDDPNIVRIELKSAANWESGLYVAWLATGQLQYVIPLFSHIQDEGIIGTGLIVPETPPGRFPRVSGLVFSVEDAEAKKRLVGQLCGDCEGASLVGFVVEGSEIAGIKFEVSVGSGLQEGSVVFCTIDGTTVYYQVINASTTEESFQQNPHGTVIVYAAQVGIWNADKGFEKFGWLPRMNSPVFKLPDAATHEINLKAGEFVLGSIPGTEMEVKASLPDLISYHTAILGVTGTGKTELVLELIRQAHAQGAKIFCVDLTGEYRKRLADLDPVGIGFRRKKAEELEEKLFDVETGKYGAGDEKRKLQEFMRSATDDAREQVDQFLRAAGSQVGLFELAEVTNTNATLLATELYLSEIMLWARSNRKSRRILIVLEEAHTIIPETRGAGFDYDTQNVVNKIGQIALQGRKYGVGLFIVSQRTALVSKTILSQCNSFLTHALVDQTSLQFLLNIYENEYVRSIPNLKFLQFIAYGKGVRSERPLLLCRPHDPAKVEASAALDDFRDINEEIAPPEAAKAAAKAQPAQAGGEAVAAPAPGEGAAGATALEVPIDDVAEIDGSVANDDPPAGNSGGERPSDG